MTRTMPAWAVSIAKWAAVAAGLGVIFAWFGVYETSQIPMPERIVYWAGLMALGVAAGTIITPLVFEKLIPTAHAAIQVALAALLISVPITIGLILMEFLSDGTLSEPAWWGQQYFYVLVVTVILTTAAWLVDLLGDMKAAATQPATSVALTGGAFTDRLPVKFRSGLIYAVSAEDHYLRVHTSVGETMILMRLADAVRELAALEGQQTHRSWWVAKQGLADITRGDGKVTLKLKSGAEAPVSRTYQKAVKDAGWL